jgi:hypothetical protein
MRHQGIVAGPVPGCTCPHLAIAWELNKVRKRRNGQKGGKRKESVVVNRGVVGGECGIAVM